LPDLDQALALRPDQALYHAYRGDLRLTLGDLDGAVTDLTRAIELDPRHLPAWANRARARCALGDHAGAAADYEAAADHVPADDDRAPRLREYAARERREGHR
ncbi:MAG: tetratricopeptide repeat protein, partial [Planctomycetota bacterium]|nr:tetratricopeptide repeat protein [Planctomycetota bacterium]